MTPNLKVELLKSVISNGERIPIGVIYKEERPLYEEQLSALKEMPLVKQRINPLQFEELLDDFM